MNNTYKFAQACLDWNIFYHISDQRNPFTVYVPIPYSFYCVRIVFIELDREMIYNLGTIRSVDTPYSDCPATLDEQFLNMEIRFDFVSSDEQEPTTFNTSEVFLVIHKLLRLILREEAKVKNIN
jgi:hypothetical protein